LTPPGSSSSRGYSPRPSRAVDAELQKLQRILRLKNQLGISDSDTAAALNSAVTGILGGSAGDHWKRRPPVPAQHQDR
jgi:hypothetical protein